MASDSIGAVMVQIQALRDWPNQADWLDTCWQIRYVNYEAEVFAVHQLLTEKKYFVNLQRLCNAAANGCEFAINNVEPDFEPSKTSV